MGEMLDGSPGVAMSSLGSAPARPVIRGLDGDRVLVLQNGEKMGDLSETAVDHAVALDPLALESVEVVRGPASLSVELSFDQNSVSASLLLRHRPIGNLEGAFGISAYHRSIHVGGEKILTPDAQNYFLAAYFYEEFSLSDQLSFQSGLRFEFREMMIGPNEGFALNTIILKEPLSYFIGGFKG